jgi:hypothetical protein
MTVFKGSIVWTAGTIWIISKVKNGITNEIAMDVKR